MDAPVTRIKTVAMPAEHGGWALILEPIVLGLLLAPSWRGVLIGLAALSCFLTRHPLKLALSDRLKKRPLPRTALATRFACIYGVTAFLFWILAILDAPKDPFIPFLFAAPFVLVQLSYDAFGHSRKLLRRSRWQPDGPKQRRSRFGRLWQVATFRRSCICAHA
jgi:MFS family permease